MLATLLSVPLLVFTQPVVQSEENVKFSVAAEGPTQWDLDDSKDPWLKGLLSKVKLDGYRVEAILHVTENSVKAWRSNGDAYPDFEGYFKTKIQNSPNTKIQFKFGKKNRIVVFRIPNSMPNVGYGISVSLNISPGEYYGINDVGRDSDGDFSYLYYPVACSDNENFASFMSNLYFTLPTDMIPVKLGQEFSVGINRYRIESINAYNPKDLKLPEIRFPGIQTFLTSLVIKKLEIKGVDQFFQGTVLAPKPKEQNSQMILDERGNFVERTHAEMTLGRMGSTYPRIQQIANDEKSQTLTLASNVNIKSLKTVQFSYNSSSKARLNNVQIDFK